VQVKSKWFYRGQSLPGKLGAAGGILRRGFQSPYRFQITGNREGPSVFYATQSTDRGSSFLQRNRVRGGYPQAGYPQAGYPQAGYPQAGYPQAGYPQAGYPQAGYPQAGYPQAGYPQAGYPQAGYPQAGYPQAGYPQAGYPSSPYRPVRSVEGSQVYDPLHQSVTGSAWGISAHDRATNPSVYGGMVRPYRASSTDQ
jgi:hypothetical protein